jgi:D-3-phosphoglycerate dehydrogenase
MKILICDGLDESGLDLLRSAEGLEVDVPEQWSMEEIREQLPRYEALIIRSRTKVTEKMLQKADRLRVIGRAGTGVDNIDVPAASDRGILVMNTPGANAMAAAEHTMALILALSRHISQATQSVREGRWEKKRFLGTEINKQTLGVIGLGRIYRSRPGGGDGDGGHRSRSLYHPGGRGQTGYYLGGVGRTPGAE